jgi:hypothetical protein
MEHICQYPRVHKTVYKRQNPETDSPEKYPMELPNQYTANQVQLKGFILSPEKIVNSQDEMLVYKEYLSELRSISKTHTNNRRPPAESIIRGYMIGDALDLLSNLNPVELSLITKTVTQCQNWIFLPVVIIQSKVGTPSSKDNLVRILAT